MGVAAIAAGWPVARARAQADASGAPDAGPAEATAAVDAGADFDRSSPPVLLEPITPAYPPGAMKSGVSGDVSLILTLDELGQVTNVEVESGLPGGLTEAAVAAARAAHFRAALDARGQPMGARIRWTAHFTLPEQRTPLPDGGAPPPAPAVTPPPAFVAPPEPAPEPLPPNVERFPIGADGSFAIAVRERGTGKSLPGATVYIEDRGELIHLDDKGRAERRLPPGAYAVVIRVPGHHQEERVERIRSGERLTRTYFVEKQRFNEYETIVHATPDRAQSGVVTLQAEEIHDIAGTFGDPFRAALLLPGVGSIISGLGYPVIRGEAPGQTGTFLDDIKVPLLYHLGAGPAVVHPQFIDELEFHAGDFPAEFGRFTGGLIRAKTTPPPTERQTMVEGDLVKVSAFHAQPFHLRGNDGAITVAARYGTLGFLAQAFNPQTVLDYWDYQTRVDLHVGPGTLRLLIFGSGDTAGSQEVTDETGEVTGHYNQLHVGFHRVDLRYRSGRWRDLSADVGIEAGVDYTTNSGSSDNDPAAGSGATPGPTPEARIREWVLRPRVAVDYRPGGALRARAGADLLFQSWERHFGTGFFDHLPISQDAITTGVFAQAEWQPTPAWLVSGGVRADYYRYAHVVESATELSFDPRLAVRRRVRPGLFVKAAAGIYHSPPRFIVPWPGLEGFGLDTNHLNRSYQLSMGAEMTLPWNATVEGQVYYNWLPRVTEYTFDLGEQNDPLGIPHASRKGQAYGVELIARRRLGQRLFGWVTYTLGRAERIYEGAGWRPTDFDQTQLINAVVSYALGRSWTVSGTFHYNSGRPDWPETAQTTASGVNTERLPQNRNIDRLPDFWRIDARIEKREAFDTWYLDFYIDWFNISLRREVTAYSYSLSPDGTAIVRRSQSAILTIPTFGLRAVF